MAKRSPLGSFIARVLPGPGTLNFAYVPAFSNPLFSPVGPGVPITQPFQLTAPAYDYKKSLVIAGHPGVPTGDFETAAYPLAYSDDVTQNITP